MRLYRTAKAAPLPLGMSTPMLIRKIIKSGEIKAYRVGKECRIPKSEIIRLLEGNTLDKVVIHARVSSRDLKEDVERPVESLKTSGSANGFHGIKILTLISTCNICYYYLTFSRRFTASKSSLSFPRVTCQKNSLASLGSVPFNEK